MLVSPRARIGTRNPRIIAESVGGGRDAGLPGAAAASAIFELTEREDGLALATLPGETRASSGGTTIACIGIPIGPMPAGDVVVRAVIAVNGQALAARPTRTLRKTAR